MINGLAAAFASLGFAILFNIRGDKLFMAALIGGVGGLLYQACLYMNCTVAMSLFLSSICISLLSEVFARVLKCPVTTFLICALIPLVPGGGMYYTMLEIVQDNIDGALVKGVDTMIQAGSIVLGCILVSSMMYIFNQLKDRKKELCQK